MLVDRGESAPHGRILESCGQTKLRLRAGGRGGREGGAAAEARVGSALTCASSSRASDPASALRGGVIGMTLGEAVDWVAAL